MGMITRVRGRLRSLHQIHQKLDPEVRDEKIAETVCLLSILFLLPYCTRGGYSPLLVSLGGWCVASYSFLVLPVLISANYKYPVRWLRTLVAKLPGLIRKWSGPIWTIITSLYAPFDKCEQVFMKMTNLSNLATQLVFFLMCDRVLLHDSTTSPNTTTRKNQITTGLYSLMFYNVIAYCVSYIKELIAKEDWSVTINMTRHSNIKHVAMSATKIVLEWTKAITFIITVTFMLLVFGLEQGLEHYQPTTFYTLLTWSYYMCTEKVFIELFPSFLLRLRLNRFDALETFYAPVILRYYTISIAVALLTILSCFIQCNYRFVMIAFYLTVYLRVKDLLSNCLRTLRSEQTILARFRHASPEEIGNCDDVCAVCLSGMSRGARVTPCQHLFHANCLRQCLKTSANCPICKREYTFVCSLD